MTIVVTGAAGFIGSAVAARLAESRPESRVRLVDRVPAPAAAGDFEWCQADLTDPAQLREALRGASRVIHLAALPGGASEADPALSRRINLDSSLNVIETLGSINPGARLVFASSIAALGVPKGIQVDDDTPAHPVMTYGSHKLMVEYALLDASRRGLVEGLALRLPGVVARPAGPSGLKSAFMSDVFRAIADPTEIYEVPVDAKATMWLLSAVACADALIHATRISLTSGTPRVFTIPALTVSMEELVQAIATASSGDTSRIRYCPDDQICRTFGRQPRLTTPRADSLGFRSDGSIERLVEVVLKTMSS